MLVKRAGSALALIFAGAFFTSAQAAPISGAESTKRLAVEFSDVQKTQVYVYGGRRYCFYVDAWNGPGWYRCGYGWREGYGWGDIRPRDVVEPVEVDENAFASLLDGLLDGIESS